MCAPGVARPPHRGGAIFSLPWGASGDSEPVRDAESTRCEPSARSVPASIGPRCTLTVVAPLPQLPQREGRRGITGVRRIAPQQVARSSCSFAAFVTGGSTVAIIACEWIGVVGCRGSAKHSVASASQSHRSNSSFFQERSGRANGMGEAARIESTRGMMSAGTEASAPGAAPALGADAGRNGEGLRTKPQGNISHMDLKRRIEENLELLQRHVHEARQEKDELLDEVEHVLQQYKHVALLNKDIAVEQMEEEQATSGRAAELYYKVKQQQRNLLAIDKDVKNMDSALFITNKLKDVSYMTGRELVHGRPTSALCDV